MSEPSRSDRALAFWRRADRWTLAGLGIGVAAMLQPWWAEGFRLGFFFTALCVVAQIVASHVAARSAAARRAP